MIEERAFCFFDARENGGYTFESCWRQAKKIWTSTCCIVGGILVVLQDIAVHLVYCGVVRFGTEGLWWFLKEYLVF